MMVDIKKKKAASNGSTSNAISSRELKERLFILFTVIPNSEEKPERAWTGFDCSMSYLETNILRKVSLTLNPQR